MAFSHDAPHSEVISENGPKMQRDMEWGIKLCQVKDISPLERHMFERGAGAICAECE